jgi:glutamyl-Q tRNA(Asp) synthetase
MTTTRFAPSPTGYLHLGHAFSALFAAKQGDRFLLRIEDIDPVRCKPEFAEALFEDLSWLGLSWEKPVRFQSQHFEDYRANLEKLRAMDLLYPCFCTRSEILAATHAPHEGETPVYPGTCHRLSKDQREDWMATKPYAWRLNVEKAIKMTGPLSWHDAAKGEQQAKPQIFGDIVLARKDIPASYHLCVVTDDALQNIDLVTRGEDLFDSTHIHRLLQALLDLPTPDYHHHPLCRDAKGWRLAKRDKSVTLRSMREQGRTPEQVRNEVLGLLHT